MQLKPPYSTLKGVLTQTRAQILLTMHYILRKTKAAKIKTSSNLPHSDEDSTGFDRWMSSQGEFTQLLPGGRINLFNIASSLFSLYWQLDCICSRLFQLQKLSVFLFPRNAPAVSLVLITWHCKVFEVLSALWKVIFLPEVPAKFSDVACWSKFMTSHPIPDWEPLSSSGFSSLWSLATVQGNPIICSLWEELENKRQLQAKSQNRDGYQLWTVQMHSRSAELCYTEKAKLCSYRITALQAAWDWNIIHPSPSCCFKLLQMYF